MNITSKSRYAIKIMIDLAQLSSETGHTQRASLAARQGIPPDYMDHILSRLRDAKLIASIRGRGGGFKLNRDAKDVSVWDIFQAVEEALMPVQCLEHGRECGIERRCSSKDAWTHIMLAVRKSLTDIRLSSLAEDALVLPDFELSLGMGGKVQECRAPRRSPVGGS